MTGYSLLPSRLSIALTPYSVALDWPRPDNPHIPRSLLTNTPSDTLHPTYYYPPLCTSHLMLPPYSWFTTPPSFFHVTGMLS